MENRGLEIPSEKRGGGSGRGVAAALASWGKSDEFLQVGGFLRACFYLCLQAFVSLEWASVAKALLLPESGEILWGFVRAGL